MCQDSCRYRTDGAPDFSRYPSVPFALLSSFFLLSFSSFELSSSRLLRSPLPPSPHRCRRREIRLPSAASLFVALLSLRYVHSQKKKNQIGGSPGDGRLTQPLQGFGFPRATSWLPWRRSARNPRRSPSPLVSLSSRRPLRLRQVKKPYAAFFGEEKLDEMRIRKRKEMEQRKAQTLEGVNDQMEKIEPMKLENGEDHAEEGLPYGDDDMDVDGGFGYDDD